VDALLGLAVAGALLLLVGALASAVLIRLAVLATASAYVLALLLDRDRFAGAAPLVAVALLLESELAHRSLAAQEQVAAERSLLLGELAALVGLAALALALGVLLLSAASVVPSARVGTLLSLGGAFLLLLTLGAGARGRL
jgi:hypothetical protein